MDRGPSHVWNLVRRVKALYAQWIGPQPAPLRAAEDERERERRAAALEREARELLNEATRMRLEIAARVQARQWGRSGRPA